MVREHIDFSEFDLTKLDVNALNRFERKDLFQNIRDGVVDYSVLENLDLESLDANELYEFRRLGNSKRPLTEKEMLYYIEEEEERQKEYIEQNKFRMGQELKILFKHTIWFLIKFAVAYFIGMIVVYAIFVSGKDRSTLNIPLLYVYSLVPTATVFGLANRKKRGDIND